VILLHALADLGEQRSVALVNGDEKVRAQEDVEIVEQRLVAGVQVFENREQVDAVLVNFRALRAVASVLNLQFVEVEAVGELVEIRGMRGRGRRTRGLLVRAGGRYSFGGQYRTVVFFRFGMELEEISINQNQQSRAAKGVECCGSHPSLTAKDGAPSVFAGSTRSYGCIPSCQNKNE